MKSPVTTPHMPKRHLGIFRSRLTLWQAVALIVSGTIGAGVLGIPYAVAQVGIVPGVLYIVLLGSAMMGLNMLLGSVCVRTRHPLQLVGLAKKYLGRWGELVMTVLFYVSMLAVLLIYIIGIGQTLAELFGGSEVFWSSAFFALATMLIVFGIRTIKTVELVLTVAILAVILVVAFWTVPHQALHAWEHFDISNIFLPYGVILFAFHAAFAIPEAHTLLLKRKVQFKHAIGISSLITIALYTVFAIAVVGVTGQQTTEIATIGLGNAIGPVMILFGNIFAVLAMGTSYLLVGLSLKHSLHWDYQMPAWLAATLISVIPFGLFLYGVTHFIEAIGFVGGVLVSLEMILMILVYLRAKKLGDLPAGQYKMHHVMVLVVLLLIICTAGAVNSLVDVL